MLDQFVCVRIIQGYGLDLDLFQYDNQLTWSVFFLNADRTVYGRYGTRSGPNNPSDVSLTGFQKAAEAALQLHTQFPAVKAALAAKTGAPARWKTPETIPSLGAYKKGDTSRQGCIHCHKIHTGELITKRNNAEAITDKDLWDFPLPDTVGLKMNVDEAALVDRVEPASAAAKAGFQPGDRIQKLNGQPLLSIADIQWVLEQQKDDAVINADVLRNGQPQALKLALQKGWRRAGRFDKKAISWALANRILGFRSEALLDTDREKLGITPDTMALKVQNIIPDWVKDGNHAIRKTGLLKGDIVLSADGRTDLRNESLFMAYAFQEKKPAEALKLSVRRADKTVEITVPIGK